MSRAAILWSHRARRDLSDIGDFIARDKPDAAVNWVQRIVAVVERVAAFPASGRIVPEVGRDDIREVILDSYRIVYQTRRNRVIVLTVFEGHRLLSDKVINDPPTD